MGTVFGGFPLFGVGEITTGVLFGFGTGVGRVIGVNVVLGVGCGVSSTSPGVCSTGMGVGLEMIDGVALFIGLEFFTGAEFIVRLIVLSAPEFEAPVGIKKIKLIKMKSPTTAPEKAASKTPIKVFAPFEDILILIYSGSSPDSFFYFEAFSKFNSQFSISVFSFDDKSSFPKRTRLYASVILTASGIANASANSSGVCWGFR